MNLWLLIIYKIMGKCILYDLPLILTHRHRLSVQIACTCLLTECRTYTACELREAVRLAESCKCVLKIIVIQHIIPLRYEIVQWTSGCHSTYIHSRLTKWYATIHASCSLKSLLFSAKRNMEFVEVLDSFLWGKLCTCLSLIL